jgi:nicotinate phosphoribosyltransferase
VYRADGFDVVGLLGEAIDGRPLLEPVVARGKTVGEPAPIGALAERCRTAVGALPARLRSLAPANPPYDVRISSALESLRDRLAAEHAS